MEKKRGGGAFVIMNVQLESLSKSEEVWVKYGPVAQETVTIIKLKGTHVCPFCQWRNTISSA